MYFIIYYFWCIAQHGTQNVLFLSRSRYDPYRSRLGCIKIHHHAIPSLDIVLEYYMMSIKRTDAPSVANTRIRTIVVVGQQQRRTAFI